MCGFVGIVASSPVIAPGALEALRHRGPDGEGTIALGPIWLGHRRLAIVDLTEGAAQPMTKAGCGTLAFNGEIYDYADHRRTLEAEGSVFDTRSDTEVLLRGISRHGMKFLTGLHGMYALAWLEPNGKKLWLARDHAGMKPLWLWRGPEGLAFSSEARSLAKAITALGARPRASASALAGFLAYGSVQEPACLLDGAEAIPPDSSVAINLDDGKVESARSTSTVRIHDLRDPPVEEVRAAVKHAVKRHIVGDVPVALFLSGGLDSAVLAVELGVLGAGSTAITVVLGTPGTSDEAEIVRRHARRHGLGLHVVPMADWSDRIGMALEAFDQPSVDGLNTYLVAGVARELGFKVALSGIGADEVFGGYGFLRSNFALTRRLRDIPMPSPLGERLARSHHRFIRRLGLTLQGRARGENVQRARRRILGDDAIQSLVGPAPELARDLPDDPLLVEQRTYLCDTLLRDTDVMGMAHGVEIRAPFLDPEVIGVARGIGTTALLDRKRRLKWPLREGWGRDLDEEALARHKTGFTLDLAHWLRTGGRTLLESSREPVLDLAVDRRSAIRTWDLAVAELQRGHASSWVRAYSLVQLAEQYRRWGPPT